MSTVSEFLAACQALAWRSLQSRAPSRIVCRQYPTELRMIRSFSSSFVVDSSALSQSQTMYSRTLATSAAWPSVHDVPFPTEVLEDCGNISCMTFCTRAIWSLSRGPQNLPSERDPRSISQKHRPQCSHGLVDPYLHWVLFVAPHRHRQHHLLRYHVSSRWPQGVHDLRSGTPHSIAN